MLKPATGSIRVIACREQVFHVVEAEERGDPSGGSAVGVGETCAQLRIWDRELAFV